MSRNVEQMPEHMPSGPTRAFVGDFDPLLQRLWDVIDHYAAKAGISPIAAAVMLANGEMPRSGL